jgi:ABC-type cobalamin/Fe3+-siderophores transport systems, ATPase components
MSDLVLWAHGLAIGWSRKVETVLASGIELELRSGELAVLIGPNGSGKSTLLRSLVGLQSPLAGEVELCGTHLRGLGPEERATLAACVFTDRFDSGYFTLFDIVAFGRYPYTGAHNKLSRADENAVRDAIEAVGLGALSHRRLSELSDGERQKALIARAVAQDCPLLVMDEPTAFLDAPARVEVFHLARGLARSSGKALVVSTHDVDHALRYADKLWLMDRSHRFSAGAPEDLVLSGQIGRAFDGEGFRFDSASGAFRSTEAGSPASVAVTGPAGPSRAWAERLVERLGFVPVGMDEAERASARIAIEEAPGGPLFAIWPKTGEKIEATSYAELAQALRGL